MRGCQRIKKDLVAFVHGELGPEDSRRVKDHIEGCPRCFHEVEELELIKRESESFQENIAEVMSTVDWEALPGRIAGKAFDEGSLHVPWTRRFYDLLLPVRWRPLTAGLLVGILVGSLTTFLILSFSRSTGTQGRDLVFTNDFLEKAELELARRETLEYLEKSQFLLFDFVQSSFGETVDLWKDEAGLLRAQELLSKKKFINPQLDKFRMAKAKEICDQIEFLLYELIHMHDHLSPEDQKRLQDLIEDKQLMLKIRLVKKELKKSEV